MKWLKRLGLLFLGLLGVIVLLVVALNVVSVVRQNKRYAISDARLEVPADSAALARGRHLVTVVGVCTDCHAPDLGGRVLIDDPLMGKLAGSNLTRGRGGLPATYSTADLARAIRHGVGRDGRSLVFMPSEGFQRFDDADLGAIIGYLATVPPVDRELPKPRIGPMSRMLHVAVGFPLLPAERVDHAAPPPSRPPAGVAYGEYLANTSGCRGCHGPALAGGAGPGTNITKGVIGSWSEADFARALREGRRPNGDTLSREMPWRSFAGLTDEEVAALWQYVNSMPAVAPQR